MNNAIDIALTRIINFIPNEILLTALNGKTEYGLENAIREEVISNMVMKDCNIGGGKTVQIQLDALWHEPIMNEMFSCYRIPSTARENRDIIEVHRIQYNPRNRPSYFAASGLTQAAALTPSDPMIHMTAFDKAQQLMLTSKTNIGGAPNTPHVEVLQGNIVRLYPSPQTHIDWLLTCRLAYDRDMTNLNSESIERFAELSLLATKIFCYRTLILKMDLGYVKFGAEIGVFKDIVSQWGNLEDQYGLLRDKFSKANSLDMTRIAALIQYAI